MNDRLTFELEAVTPLFLGGAEPRGEPELRAASFRGALRYWLRALAGGVLGDNVADVREIEAQVFGDTSAQSVITVRIVVPKCGLRPQTYSKAGRTRTRPSGQDYLYWTMDKSGKHERGNYQPPHQFFAERTKFSLILSAVPGVTSEDGRFQQAVAATWLFLNLGGIGSRSRRTGGSLSVLSPSSVKELPFALQAQTPSEAAQALKKGLQYVGRVFQRPRVSSLPQPQFDALHPDACQLWVLDKWNTSGEAIEAIGIAMQSFRNRRPPDYPLTAEWLEGGSIPTVERAIFGLPLPVRYSRGGPSGVVQGRYKHIDRRASPLWLRVSKSASGAYFGIATLFKAQFLPDGEQLHAGRQRTSPPDDFSLIEKFIDEKFPHRQEVTL
jgi:CRISPR-associated protein Cmr1